MAMAELPEKLFIDSLTELVTIDREWIPPGEDASLYLRPFMFASEVFLGVKPSAEYTYMVIASPAGAYFKGGVRPITILGFPRSSTVRARRYGRGQSAAGTSRRAVGAARRSGTAAPGELLGNPDRNGPDATLEVRAGRRRDDHVRVFARA